MGIKIADPKNSILIEGLWGLGKTELSQSYCTKYGYKFIPEPLHTREVPAEKISVVDSWYLHNHKKQEQFFEDSLPALVERSVLSTFAFLYALEKPLPDISYVSSLKNIIEKNKVLVVYLKADNEFFSETREDLNKYSSDIRSILLDAKARERYDEWYTKILPREYGILPFVVSISADGLRRPMEELINDINLALVCNRIAQINAICFTKAVAEERLKILVLKRSVKKGGFWQTITGGVHPGEDPLDTAQREIAEEIGSSEDSTLPFWTSLVYSFVGDDGYQLNEYVFGCEIKDPSKVRLSQEHEEFEWCDPQEAKQKVAYENNKRAIDIVCKKIEQSM